ncbi:hypothetical protein BV22DRAFT_1125528 [Leucogyrophana mollusca]|uniref:Uncharacterized protein n=1 Tax=Leucogyrophana mollusca TaxID=85980 RepID=A0ACB8BY76_9AGAM|nr:hypothetical protein BV22DRAFT_1125528 [Leucogyrophana mollusca]
MTQDDEYVQPLIEEIVGKYHAGFAVSYNHVTHVIMSATPPTEPRPATSLTIRSTGRGIRGLGSLTCKTSFETYSQSFPILVATLLSPNSNPITELKIYKMGSCDPTLTAFTPNKYPGMTNEFVCVTNLDQTGTVIGASGYWNTIHVARRCSRPRRRTK